MSVVGLDSKCCYRTTVRSVEKAKDLAERRLIISDC